MSRVLDDRGARMALLAAVEPASPGVAELVTLRGAQDAWQRVLAGELGTTRAQRAASVEVAAMERAAERVGARFLVPGDEEWPTQVDGLAAAGEVQGLGGAPLGLWLRGAQRLPGWGVAVVGSRACTSYGDTAASMLAGDLAALGVPVVSGGAYGIDAAAHRGAVAAGGLTVAVLACGVDEVYPPGQAGLLHRLAEDHVVVSEYPPGSTPTRMRFLARNRLIAALCDGTVLVEAAARSGAKNTVNWAARLGRVVMAVPGPIHSAQSYTPHQLIRDQEAVLVDDAASIVAMVVPPSQEALFDAEGETREVDGLTQGERAALDALPRRGDVSLTEVALAASLRAPEAAQALRGLERRGLADEGIDGRWSLRRTDASRAVGAARGRHLG